MPTIASIAIDFTTNVAKISNDMNRVQRTVTKTVNNIRNVALAAFATIVPTAMIKNAVNTAAALKDMSDQTRISAEKIQVLRYAFQQNGVEMSQTDGALVKFSTTLGNAVTKGGETAKVFEMLGVATRDASGNIRPTNAVLDDTVAALSRVGNQAQRQSLSATLFGKEAGPAMATMLGQGVEGLNKYGAELQKVGGIMSNDMVRKAGEAKDKMAALHQIMETNFNIGIMQSFTDEFGKFTDMATDPALAQGFRDLGTLVGDIAGALAKAATSMASLYKQAREAAGILDDASMDEGLLDRSEELLKEIEAAKTLLPFRKNQVQAEMELNKLLREREGILAAVGEKRTPKIVQVSGTISTNTIANPNLILDTKNTDKARAGIERLNKSVQTVEKSADKMGDTFGNALQDITRMAFDGSLSVQSLGQVAASILGDIFKSSDFQSGSSSFFSSAFSGIGSFFSSMFSGLPSFDAGTNYVQKSGLAMIHEGEEIRPARANRGWQGGDGGGVVVNVNNYGGGQVTQRTSRRNGQTNIDIDFDRMMATKLRDPGSYTGNATGMTPLTKR